MCIYINIHTVYTHAAYAHYRWWGTFNADFQWLKMCDPKTIQNFWFPHGKLHMLHVGRFWAPSRNLQSRPRCLRAAPRRKSVVGNCSPVVSETPLRQAISEVPHCKRKGVEHGWSSFHGSPHLRDSAKNDKNTTIWILIICIHVILFFSPPQQSNCNNIARAIPPTKIWGSGITNLLPSRNVTILCLCSGKPGGVNLKIIAKNMGWSNTKKRRKQSATSGPHFLSCTYHGLQALHPPSVYSLCMDGSILSTWRCWHTLRRFQYTPKLTKSPRAPGLPKNLQKTSGFGRFIRIFKQFCLSVSIDIGFVHIVGNVLWPHMPGRLASSRCLAIFRKWWTTLLLDKEKYGTKEKDSDFCSQRSLGRPTLEKYHFHSFSLMALQKHKVNLHSLKLNVLQISLLLPATSKFHQFRPWHLAASKRKPETPQLFLSIRVKLGEIPQFKLKCKQHELGINQPK